MDGFLGASFDAAGWLGKALGADKTAARCPWDDLHTTGKPKDGSTVIFSPADGKKIGWGYCSHSHCVTRTLDEWIDAIPEDAKATARERLGMDSSYTPRPDSPVVITQDNQWENSLIHNGKGKVTKDAGNAAVLLANLPELVGCLAYDEFRNTPFWMRQPPPLDGMSLPPLGPCEESRWLYIQQILGKLKGVSFSKDAIFDAVLSASLEQPFHPVRDYFALLHWDQIPRVERWLHTYLGVADTPYSRLVSRWWLVSAVARVFDPGCKVDSIMVLEGPQGIGKSTALRILGKHWFCDSPIDIGNKDAYLVIRGKWIIELAELASLIKSDASTSKSFITSPIDTYRAPYRREVCDIPRQGVFAGTLNLYQYLHDETGGRRYLPVICSKIDVKGLERDVDMLWAEAYHMYRSQTKWWPTTQTEIDLCADEQSQRYVGDEWEHVIGDYMKVHTEHTEFYTHTILTEVLRYLPKEWKKSDEMRVAKCLKRLGYRQNHRVNSRPWVK